MSKTNAMHILLTNGRSVVADSANAENVLRVVESLKDGGALYIPIHEVYSHNLDNDDNLEGAEDGGIYILNRAVAAVQAVYAFPV